MTYNTDFSPLMQIKIDYVSYMTQIFKLMAYDEIITSILYALMVEGEKYLTQEDLELLTGFSRSSISEALSKVSVITQDFPIIQTRKPGDKKKYYYCPITFEEYVKRSFLVAADVSKLSMEFLPELTNRLDVLSPQTPSIHYVKRVFIYLFAAISYYEHIMKKSNESLDKMFDDTDYEPNFSGFINKIQIALPKGGSILSNDTFDQIKLDFITRMISMSTELLGGNEELIAVFLALMLEKDPVTQDELIKLTGASRSNVSRALSMMEDLKILDIIKKQRDRKKYYKSKTRIEDYGLGKLKRVQGYYAQIQMMMQKKFLPDLEKVKPVSEQDKTEKDRLTKFFKDNNAFFNIFINFSSSMHMAVQDELRVFVEKHLS
jgi:DNA-binding transcriptional regulator GbsR (MarR family)